MTPGSFCRGTLTPQLDKSRKRYYFKYTSRFYPNKNKKRINKISTRLPPTLSRKVSVDGKEIFGLFRIPT